MAGKEFAVVESRRMRRLLEDAGELGSDSLLGPVLQVTPAAADVDASARALLQTLAGGGGGAAEAVQLLMQLAGDDLSAERRAQVVEVLLRRPESPDEARLRNIAHELARQDRKAAAADLYRLGVLAGGEGMPAFLSQRDDEEPAELIADVQARLGGQLGRDTALALIDDKLAREDSASMLLAALKAWPALVSPAQLQERLGAVKERMARLRSGRLGRFAYDDDAQAFRRDAACSHARWC